MKPLSTCDQRVRDVLQRWLLYPPEHEPPFDPDESALHWLRNRRSGLTGLDAELLLECEIQPGEVLYFPSWWWHAVVNMQETVFVSSFDGGGGRQTASAHQSIQPR
jgi:Cupin-like domain